jgi:putative ABC transport system substrate-binding protein
MMDRRTFIGSVASSVLAAPLSAFAQAQQAKAYRVGVILEGGPYYAIVDGLKDGLKELGFTEGKHYVLEIRDLTGDRRAAEAAARSLERENVELIYSIGTSVTTVVKRATTEIPVVFVVGEDPVVAGLAQSFAKPGGDSRASSINRQISKQSACRSSS